MQTKVFAKKNADSKNIVSAGKNDPSRNVQTPFNNKNVISRGKKLPFLGIAVKLK